MQCGLISLGFMSLAEQQFCTWPQRKNRTSLHTRFFVEQIRSWVYVYNIVLD